MGDGADEEEFINSVIEDNYKYWRMEADKLRMESVLFVDVYVTRWIADLFFDSGSWPDVKRQLARRIHDDAHRPSPGLIRWLPRRTVRRVGPKSVSASVSETASSTPAVASTSVGRSASMPAKVKTGQAFNAFNADDPPTSSFDVAPACSNPASTWASAIAAPTRESINEALTSTSAASTSASDKAASTSPPSDGFVAMQPSTAVKEELGEGGSEDIVGSAGDKGSPPVTPSMEVRRKRKFEDIVIDAPKIEECSICLEQYTDGSLVRTLPCTHEYHDWCLRAWLSTDDGKSSCPLCRQCVQCQMPKFRLIMRFYDDDDDDDEERQGRPGGRLNYLD